MVQCRGSEAVVMVARYVVTIPCKAAGEGTSGTGQQPRQRGEQTRG